MSFDLLMTRLNGAVLAKSLAADAGDEKKIQAAADDGANGDDDGAGDGDGDGDGAGDGDDDGKKNDDAGGAGDDKPMMAKSFTLALEDGTELEAFDGTEMVKALTLRLDATEAALKTTEEALATSEVQVLKSLNLAADLIAAQSVTATEQGALIKSLQGQVVALSKMGRGRVSTLVMTEKPQLESTLAKSMPAQMGANEILAKAMSAMKTGRITGLEAAGIETRLNMGIVIEPELITRISSN